MADQADQADKAQLTIDALNALYEAVELMASLVDDGSGGPDGEMHLIREHVDAAGAAIMALMGLDPSPLQPGARARAAVAAAAVPDMLKPDEIAALRRHKGAMIGRLHTLREEEGAARGEASETE